MGRVASDGELMIQPTRTMPPLRLSTSGLFVVLVATSAVLSAHPISLSSAILDVHEEHITADIQIMLEDLVLYHGLSADADYRYSADELRKAAKKHTKFLQKYFTIRNEDGELLAGKLQELDLKKIDAEGVRQTELMKKSVAYIIEYPMKTRQAFLTFAQTFGGRDAVLPAVMDLMLLQNGFLLDRPLQLTLGRPHSAKFDWDNPPTRAPRSMRDLRAMRDKQLRERLGIATYGGLYSFLYITRFEVRHEILVPLLTLEQWMPIPRKNPDFLEVEEQAAARDEISKFFDQRTSVSINRMGVAPKLTRLSFFGLDINDFAQNAEPRRVSVHQARAGVILSYPSKTLVRDVAMNWNTFSEYAPFVRTIVLVGDADPAEHVFRVSQPSFSWSGDLIAARVEPVVAQTQSLDERAARPVLQKLLRNVYSAFEFGSDSEVYDALATSVQGELLREIYLQMKRSLVMAEQGGALSRVTDLEILALLLVRNPDLAFDVTWRVTGTVEHWGHLHRRVNQYQATMSLSRDGGLWKLTGLQIRSEQRVKFDTGIRGYETGEKRVKKASTP